MTARPFKLTRPEPSEAAVLSAVRTALQYHPAVAMCIRYNSGAMESVHKGRKSFIRFQSEPGHADLAGLLKGSGRFFAIEVKTRTGKPTADQIAFLERVRASGGIAGIARSAKDAIEIINEATQTRTMVCA